MKALGKTRPKKNQSSSDSESDDVITTRRPTSVNLGKKKSIQSYASSEHISRHDSKRHSSRDQVVTLPKKRGRPKKFTDEQLEAMTQEAAAATEKKAKETIAFFTGN